ncbi:hypothetical protein SAY86_020635 [Trapa natans]|uniref:Protein kinase domain-containing protein n=1 Tax=Trapa natans TaxID=22666 RepID=A0AAN7R6P9_TRANT|nr:hypothetical protein SAY86_020635 [Trapa natans]
MALFSVPFSWIIERDGGGHYKGAEQYSKPDNNSFIGSVLGRSVEDIKPTYTIGKELGPVNSRSPTSSPTRPQASSLHARPNEEDMDDVKREVQIMYHLTGHPNIVELKGAYEDKQYVHLVMELCARGDLLDRIIAKGHYTERAVASEPLSKSSTCATRWVSSTATSSRRISCFCVRMRIRRLRPRTSAFGCSSSQVYNAYMHALMDKISYLLQALYGPRMEEDRRRRSGMLE